jgi:hypothetical protein
MQTEVIIIGGLLDTPSSARQTFVDRLKNEVASDVEWNWVSCDAQFQFEVSVVSSHRVGDFSRFTLIS